jgi:hypothetical protein
MAVVVSLRDLVDELQTLSSDERHVYLNKVTGKVISVTNDDFAIVANVDESEFAELGDNESGDSDLEQDFFSEVKRISLFDDDYLELPSKFDIHEYEIMERFSLSIPNRKIGDVLLDKIRGSGAFRRFKDMIYRYGVEKDWFKFRDEAYKDIAIAWLQSHDFTYVDDMNRREKSI